MPITLHQEPITQMTETTDKAACSYMAMPEVQTAAKESAKQIGEMEKKLEQLVTERGD